MTSSVDTDAVNPNPNAETTEYSAQNPRRIRSFVLRTGRMGSGQIKALNELSPRFVLPYQPEPLNAEAAFGRAAPLILEIGFGMGGATAHIAQVLPQTNFLGVEVHTPGVGALMKLLDEQSIDNIRIVSHDAVDVLQHMLAPDSLHAVHIFFPDPWHKARHHKRRLIQPEFLELLASRVHSGGYIHCATDWQPYAEHMLEVLQTSTSWRNRSTEGFAVKPEYRPLTKFEARGLRLGHGVWDLVFDRV